MHSKFCHFLLSWTFYYKFFEFRFSMHTILIVTNLSRVSNMLNKKESSVMVSWLSACLFAQYFAAWKVFKYGVFSGPYFPVFGLDAEIYFVNLRIQSEYGKIRTKKNSVFKHFSHGVCPQRDAFFRFARTSVYWTEDVKWFRLLWHSMLDLLLSTNFLKITNSSDHRRF